MTRRALRTGLVAAVLLATSGCGVRSDDTARNLSVGRVPYGLLDDAPTSATTIPPTPAVPRTDVNVYFIENDRMTRRVRQVNAPATVPKALTALLFGPQENEIAEEVRSAIDPTASIQARAIDASTYLVDLSAEFAKGSSREQVLALAQIVYTATQIPGVVAVRFTLDGVPIEVPTGSGSLTAEPVGRDAFAQFEPLPEELGGPT